MKHVKYLSMLTLVVLSVAFTSCNKDEEVNSKELVGTWTCVWSEGWVKYENYPKWDEEWNEAGDSSENMTFNADNTGKDGDGVKFVWTLEDDQLGVKAPDDDTYSYATIIEFSAEKLVVEKLTTAGPDAKDGPYERYMKYTYTKN